jgi:Protein of unknown function (DUF3551)
MIIIRAAFALLAVAAFATIDARRSVAEIYRPWCVSYPWVGVTCTFTSFEQCMMTAGPGTGGSCAQNPWYLAYGERPKDRPHGSGKHIKRE